MAWVASASAETKASIRTFIIGVEHAKEGPYPMHPTFYRSYPLGVAILRFNPLFYNNFILCVNSLWQLSSSLLFVLTAKTGLKKDIL